MFLEPTECLLTGYSTESIWTPKSANSTPHRMRSRTQGFFSHTLSLGQEPTRAQRRFGEPRKKLCHRHLLCPRRCLHLRDSPPCQLIHNQFHLKTSKVIKVTSARSVLHSGKSSTTAWLFNLRSQEDHHHRWKLQRSVVTWNWRCAPQC